MNNVFRFEVLEKKEEAAQSVLFILKPLDDFKYKAGQFLTFLFDINGRKIRRSYSLCTEPSTDPFPSILVKRISNGEISRYMQDVVQPGDILQSINAAGKFILEDDVKESDIFLIAAGSGISPILSLMKRAAPQHNHNHYHLFYSNHNRESAIFLKETEQIVSSNTFFTADYFFSDAKNLYRARLHRTLLEELIRQYLFYPVERALFYICGPFEFMQMVELVLTAYGIARNNIRKENFLPDVLPQRKTEWINKEPKIVKIKFNKTIYSFSMPYNKSILDVALENNIELPYNCKSGQCGACTGKCISGKVEMSYNEVLTDRDEQNGYILTCTGHPFSEDVVIEI